MNSFLILAVLSLLLCFGTCSLVFKGANFIYTSVMSVLMFFCSHIISTMGLFVIDCYSLFRGMAGTFFIAFACFAVLTFINIRKKPQKFFEYSFDMRAVIIPIVVSLLAFPFTANKNELFGMGQDEGVYQCVAINFMNGIDRCQQDFEEYHMLESDFEKEAFKNSVKGKLIGYDIPSETYPDTVYDRNVSEVSGIYHGIPTYPALLAMWGQLFGMKNMMNIETVFYILAIFLVSFVCTNLRLSYISNIIACVSTAVSPVIIWVSKSSLTEMFLAVLVMMFIMFLTDEGHKKYQIFSIIPVIVYACYHVSVYTLIPYVLMVYGGMYLFTRRKVLAVLLLSTVPVYAISYFAMRQIQPFYTMNNYSPVFFGGIGVHNISNIVACACAILMIACALYVTVIRMASKNFSRRNFLIKMQKSIFMKIFIIAMLIVPVAYIIFKAFYKYDNIEYAGSLAIVGFAVMSGLVIFPMAIIVSAVNSGFFLERVSRLVILVSFFYCILVYSAFLRYDIQYYYYYSRYLAPFVPVAIVFSVMVLDRFSKKLIVPVSLAGIVFTSPYNIYLSGHKDDTRMEWEVLDSVTEYINSDDCIIIDWVYAPTLWIPLKAMTGADVFPQIYDTPDLQIESLKGKYNDIYYISRDSKIYNSESNLEIIYMDKVHISEDVSEDVGNLIPLPKSFRQTERYIHLYRAIDYDYYYDHNDIVKWSISGVKQSDRTFCWTEEKRAEIRCNVNPDDYELTVSLGSVIPLKEINKNSLKINLYVNGIFADSSEINSVTNGDAISFDISEDYFEDGANTITLETELWNASAVNSDDTRILGIPVESLEFVSK